MIDYPDVHYWIPMIDYPDVNYPDDQLSGSPSWAGQKIISRFLEVFADFPTHGTIQAMHKMYCNNTLTIRSQYPFSMKTKSSHGFCAILIIATENDKAVHLVHSRTIPK